MHVRAHSMHDTNGFYRNSRPLSSRDFFLLTGQEFQLVHFLVHANIVMEGSLFYWITVVFLDVSLVKSSVTVIFDGIEKIDTIHFDVSSRDRDQSLLLQRVT